MIFKKFIGAVTALVMTMTMFVGLADSAGAAMTVNYKLTFSVNNVTWEETIINSTDLNQYISINNVVTFEGEHAGTYLVSNFSTGDPDIGEDNIIIPYTITLSPASILTINVNGSGSVFVNNAINISTDETPNKYAAAVDTEATITFVADPNSYIESITGLDDTDVPDDTNSNYTAKYTFKDDAIISVNFGTTYDITTNKAINGSFSVVPEKAKVGESITVYTNPEDGYELDEITVTPANGKESIQVNINGSMGTFTMPAADVTVSVTFREEITLPNEKEAIFVNEYDDLGSPPATLWEGTLDGYGSTSFKPSVTVTLKNNVANNESDKEKTIIGSTTVTGNSSIYLAIVVDKAKDDIEKVWLKGVTTDIDSTNLTGKNSVYIDEFPIIPDTNTEEAE